MPQNEPSRNPPAPMSRWSRALSVEYALPAALGVVVVGSLAFAGYHALEGLAAAAAFYRWFVSLADGSSGWGLVYIGGAAATLALLVYLGVRLALDSIGEHAGDKGLPAALLWVFLIAGLGMPIWGAIAVGLALLWPFTVSGLLYRWRQVREEAIEDDEEAYEDLLDDVREDARGRLKAE